MFRIISRASIFRCRMRLLLLSCICSNRIESNRIKVEEKKRVLGVGTIVSDGKNTRPPQSPTMKLLLCFVHCLFVDSEAEAGNDMMYSTRGNCMHGTTRHGGRFEIPGDVFFFFCGCLSFFYFSATFSMLFGMSCGRCECKTVSAAAWWMLSVVVGDAVGFHGTSAQRTCFVSWRGGGKAGRQKRQNTYILLFFGGGGDGFAI